jgi:hypothetical protein
LSPTHARDGSITPRDLIGRLDAPNATDRYRVTARAEQIGIDGKLTDWLSGLIPRNRLRI